MRKLCFILVPLLLVACTDSQPVAPIEDGPLFNWMNNPDNGNLRINRFMDHFAISWTDPENGLRATHTTFPIGDEPDCGPQELLDDLVAYQDVGIYEDDFLASWLRSIYDGENLWLIVRDVTQAGDCYGAMLIGQGTTRIHGTDNDVFAWYEGSTRMNNNSYGWTAGGKLTTVGGEVLDYRGVFRDVWDPQAFEPIHTTAKVTLR